MALPFAIRTLVVLTLATTICGRSTATAQTPPPASPAQRTPPRDTPPPPPQTGTAIIRGHVVAADGARPLRRVQIRFTAPEVTGQGRTTSSDEAGVFEMTDLPAGRYTVTATRGGFLTLRYGQRRPREQGKIVELADGQTVDNIDFALPRMSVISGRITDEDGEPIAGVTVVALRSIYFSGRRQMIPTSELMVRTDDVGEYRIGGLVPGTYAVSATSGDKWTVDAGGRDETMGYVPTYFPGTTNVAEARPITVGLGHEATATDFSLIPGRAATVSGTAFDSHGRPFQLVVLGVEIRSERGGFFSSAGNVRVAANGSFTFRNVAPGDYRLRAARTDSEPEVAFMRITVDGTDMTNLALTGSAGGTVSGQVVLADGVAAKMPRVQIAISERWLGQPDPLMLGVFRGRYTAVTPAPGDESFVVSNVFGPARFNVTVPDGWVVNAIVHNGRDITDAPIELRNGEQLSDVHIILTDRVTTIGGTIADEAGAPADGTVVMFATAPEKWFESSRFVRAVRPDQRGRHEIKGLPPGDYLAVAVDYAEDGAWNEPEYLQSLRRYAQPVTIDTDAPRTLSLKLVSAP